LSQKRHADQSMVAAGLCSQRQACRYLGLARSSWAYERRPPTARAGQLRDCVAALALRHPRYGYRRTHDMRRRQGLYCSLRIVQRLRRELDLGIVGPAARPKVPRRPDAKIKATAVKDVWCVDVVFDTTAGGATVKFLTILDECSHTCLDLVASRRMCTREVVAALPSPVGDPRSASSSAVRQRCGVYCEAPPALVGARGCPNLVHRARQPMAKWHHRKLQRPLPRQVLEPRTVGQPLRCVKHRTEFPRRIQYDPPSQYDWLSHPGGVSRRTVGSSSRLRSGPQAEHSLRLDPDLVPTSIHNQNPNP
jgi:hypothetical protein